MALFVRGISDQHDENGQPLSLVTALRPIFAPAAVEKLRHCLRERRGPVLLRGQ